MCWDHLKRSTVYNHCMQHTGKHYRLKKTMSKFLQVATSNFTAVINCCIIWDNNIQSAVMFSYLLCVTRSPRNQQIVIPSSIKLQNLWSFNRLEKQTCRPVCYKLACDFLDCCVLRHLIFEKCFHFELYTAVGAMNFKRQHTQREWPMGKPDYCSVLRPKVKCMRMHIQWLGFKRTS